MTSMQGWRRMALLLAAGAPLLAPPAFANGSLRVVEISETQVGAVKVVAGKSQNLRTSRGFVDLVVGDPEIADVMPLTDRTLYVLGRKIGVTNVSVYDAEKRLVGMLEIEVAYDGARIAADAARLGPGAPPQVSSANGRTVLSGAVADAPAAEGAIAVARHYGPEVVNNLKVTRPQQVLLEVRFVEASRNAGKALGVGFEGARFGENPRTGSVRGTALLTGLTGLAGGGTPFGALVGTVLAQGVQADILIQALEDKGLARRLAEPNLVALSGEKASFLAGGEFPIPVAGDENRITVEYKKFGVGLTFTPTVLSDGVINLRIEPEVSQIDPTTVVRTASVTVPAITVRRASTVVELRDGQSFAVAGLLQSYNAQTTQQLPWLGDIPIIGALFRSAAFERRETDLAIIVTPRLVKPAKPGERLRTPFDTTVAGSEADLFLNGRGEIPIAEAKAGASGPPTGHILDLRRAAVVR